MITPVFTTIVAAIALFFGSVSAGKNVHFRIPQFQFVNNIGNATYPITHIHSYYSSVIPAPINEVWEYIGDFGDVLFIPGILGSKIVVGADNQIGCIRLVDLGKNFYSQEMLLSYSLAEFYYEYTVLNITPGAFPGPFYNYDGILRATAVTDGNQSFVEWDINFDTLWTAREACALAFASSLQSIFASIKRHFA